jgi:hypothetical protein
MILANFLGTGVLFNVTKSMKIEYSMYISAGVLFAFTVATFFMLRDRKIKKEV